MDDIESHYAKKQAAIQHFVLSIPTEPSAHAPNATTTIWAIKCSLKISFLSPLIELS